MESAKTAYENDVLQPRIEMQVRCVCVLWVAYVTDGCIGTEQAVTELQMVEASRVSDRTTVIAAMS
jgi:hypothetical protein